MNGSERFDLYTQADGGALLDDIEAMRQYHIIFIPCMSQVGMGALSPSRIENIRQWVGEGGKWYVTDWANEYMFQTFPLYQTFHQQATNPDLNFYNTTGTVLDADLLAWLQALPDPLKNIGGGLPDLYGLPAVDLHDNWSGLDAIPPVTATNEDGEAVDVGHYPWVEGPCQTCAPTDVRPMTVSAEFGCGRMMFSTYHTNETAHAGLSPQELILLYIILEIGVCHDQPPPQPPPRGDLRGPAQGLTRCRPARSRAIRAPRPDDEGRMKILVVDDSKVMRMLVKRTLRQAGYGSDVVEAANGKEGLAQVDAEKPDLILSDWNMPEMSGMEFLEALSAAGNSTAFGFVTSESSDAMREKAKEAGAKFLIAKPFTPETFKEKLDAALAA